MIEACSFIAAFAVQILVASVLSPMRLITYVRGWAKNFGSERLAELYPDFDYDRWARRFVAGFRTAHIATTLTGVALMAWLMTMIGQPNWIQRATIIATAYFIFQMSPLIVTSLYVVIRYWKLLMQPSKDKKRKATLQRRGLSDFVSPAAIAVMLLAYPLFVAYSIWLDLYVYDNATLSRECLISLVSISFVYAFNGFILYRSLYSRRNPLMTDEGRVHSIGVQVKSCVYSSIAVVLFMSLFGTLGQPSLTEWRPFALSIFFIICSLLTMADLKSPSRKPDDDALDPVGKLLS